MVGDSKDETLKQWGRLKLLKVSVSSGEDGSDTVLKARILDRGVNVGVDEPVEREVSGIGNGPIAAFLNAVSNFGIEASVMDYVEHTMSVGTDAMAASYVECQIGEEDNTSIVWGRRHRYLHCHQLAEGHHLGHQPFRALIALIARTR